MYSPPFVPIDTTTPIIYTVLAEEGKMFRFEIEQDSTMPKIAAGPIAWAAVEGAKPDNQGLFKVLHFTQYYTDNTNPSISYDCRETESFVQFNSKTVQSKGYGPLRFVEKNIPIEYQIKFLNTTPSIVSSVEIIDTIPEFLDLNSLVIGASSHTFYDVNISGRVLKIHYPSIFLTNPTIDSSSSFGSISFYLNVDENVSIGAVVENSALIVLNYIDSIRTQTTHNIISENFIQIVSDRESIEGGSSLLLYPNPSSGNIQLEYKGRPFEMLRFELFDISGRQLFEKIASENNFNIELPKLIAGVYLYRVSTEHGNIDSGKLILKR